MPETSIAGTVKGPRILASLIDYALFSFLTAVLIFIFIIVPAPEASAFELLGSNLMGLVFTTLGTLHDILETMDISGLQLSLSGIILVLVAFVYFSFIPYKWNGQTIGKKLMHIKAVNEAYENPSLRQHILRSVRVYNIYLVVVFLPLVAAIAGLLWLAGMIENWLQAFVLLLDGAMTFGGMLYTVSAFMVVLRQDAKGLHDMVARTMVIPENTPFEAESETSETKK
ncbi:MAG: RDD family protein [Bacillota bacterium]